MQNIRRLSAGFSPRACKHKSTQNCDILQRSSCVRAVFCFKDSARARAPSSPMPLSGNGQEKCKTSAGYQPDSHHAHANVNPLKIPKRPPARFRYVRAVFCFKDSARARAPSTPMLLSGHGQDKCKTSAGYQPDGNPVRQSARNLSSHLTQTPKSSHRNRQR